jgi:adenosylhomocysteine nucleosidase
VSKPKLGILVAMAPECRSLTPKRIPADGFLALDEGCLIGLSGAGPEAAARCATLLAGQGVTALLSWGCAAALDPALKSGDLVLPASIIGADGQTLETDPAWRGHLVSQLEPRIKVYQGKLLESRRIVSSAQEKRALFAATGAVALDMESAAAARTALALGIPFLTVRSIVDPAHMDIPPSIAAAFDDNGVLHVSKMIGLALLRPVDFIGIIRLGQHFGAAMKHLKAVAALARASHFAIPQKLVRFS